ncbi:type II toxin-antitoxin system HicB family antitoxin [Methylopila sp. 73B]|uniref:type II toxin-antitoxin system HicB family antitoxin n=1 Tax=Methylopila sp. 73B TaxID=1120792 RepID=UPI000364903B|nr:type II toxin-antitoxin system HicB family antitoxin [Methylopila sp. 73B]
MRDYIALIHKDADSDFGVSFPDLPGCVTAGATLDEARALAQEALALHLQGMAEDGEAAPEPSSLEVIMSERANRDAVAAVIPGPKGPAKALRISVTVPEDLLGEVDAYAEAHGYTRSGFLQAAARRAMRDDESAA